MKIAIDISPLSTGHKVRGTGFYLKYLQEAMLKYFPENDYQFFKQGETVDHAVDIVHYPYFDPFFQTLPFIKKHKTVVTVHDLTPLVFPSHFPAGIKGNINWQWQRFKLQHVDVIVTDSLASQRDIVKIVGFDQTRVAVAYLAAAEEFTQLKSNATMLKTAKEKYGLPDHFVLYVGDVTWNKNVPRLVKAVQKINIPLILVGKSLVSKEFDRKNVWNKDLIEVQTLAEQNKHVSLLGFVPAEDLAALYNLATVFVFPSVYEGFGLPIVEAMQSGCPVIISHESCMPEVGGEAVVYFDGYNTDSLTDALVKVFFSKKLQKDLSQKGLDQVKKFSWEKTAEQTMHVYKKVLEFAA